MNVFDDEMGPLAPEDEALRFSLLASAGMTLEELRAWERMKEGKVN